MTQTLDYAAQFAAAQKKAEEARVETRTALLTELRALGVTLLEVQYEGYGDSGNVEDVNPDSDGNQTRKRSEPTR